MLHWMVKKINVLLYCHTYGKPQTNSSSFMDTNVVFKSITDYTIYRIPIMNVQSCAMSEKTFIDRKMKV